MGLCAPRTFRVILRRLLKHNKAHSRRLQSNTLLLFVTCQPVPTRSFFHGERKNTLTCSATDVNQFNLFSTGEGYVIRWAYYVMNDRIAKDRKSRCRSTIAGRVRTAYYFWQGNDCTVNEKGAAAVMAVELDEERGPQVPFVVIRIDKQTGQTHALVHSTQETHMPEFI